MKKRTLLAIILATVMILVSSNVDAAVYTVNRLELPSLEDLKDANISAYAEYAGITYNGMYGLDCFMYDGRDSEGNYGPRRDYNKGQGSDSSLPFPFDEKLEGNAQTGVFALALSSKNDSVQMTDAIAFTAGYCIGWGVPFGEYKEEAQISSMLMKVYTVTDLKKDRDGNKHEPEHIRAINYVLTYGYNYPVIRKEDMYPYMPVSYRANVMEGMHWYVAVEVNEHHKEMAATQYAAWIAANGFMVDNSQDREDIEEYFFSGNNVRRDGVDQVYIGIRNNVLAAMRMPSYSYATQEQAVQNKIELKWSEENQRFESYVQDTNKMNKASRVLLSYNNADSSLHFEQQDDGSVLIWTKSVVGNLNEPEVLNVTKTIKDAKEFLAVSKSSDRNHQPIALAIPGEIVESQYVAVYTQAIRIEVEKGLIPINGKTGDATPKDCTFGVYSDPECTIQVEDLVVKADGSTDKTTYLPYQTYYLKETKNNSSTLLNEQVYTVDPTTAKTDADGDFVVTNVINNEIVPTKLRVRKFADEKGTEESPAKGAILRLELNSNPNEYYLATVNGEGVAEFTEIPYGTYTLTEDDTNSNYLMKIDPVVLKMTRHMDEYVYHVITGDYPIPVYPKLIKVDAVSGLPIKQAGIQFKIWDCQEKDWVRQPRYPDGQIIDVFETTADGTFTTPEVLTGGEYVIYEIKGPEGYYLNPKYNVPANEADLGDTSKNGVKLSLTADLVVDVDSKGNMIYGVEIENEPLKGRVQVIKTGEMLTEVADYITIFGEIKDPIYTQKALEGVEYTLTVKEDIKSPDGSYVYAKKGTQYVIRTNSEGIATSEPLYLGTYEVEETKTPLGFVKEENIPDITLTNEDPNEEIKTTSKQMQNDKQKTDILIKKKFDKSEYVVNKDRTIEVVVGIFANQDITNYNKTKTLINKDDLVGIAAGTCDVKGNEITLSCETNLPEGKYYVRELSVDAPYVLDETKYEFEVKFTDVVNPKITIDDIEIVNTEPTGLVTLIKLSSSSLGNVTLEGDQVVTEDADERMNQILEDIKGLTEEEIKDYLADNNIKFVAGAEYSVFLDEECKNPLYIINEETDELEDAKLVTDDTGLIKIEKLPIGEYYLKETKAPVGYEPSEEIVKIILTKEDKNTTVYKALKDDAIANPGFTKIDIFTGEPIAKCKFEVRDEDGNLLVYSVTDENGEGYIPIDRIENGKKYTYTEIEAPGIYNLNTEPHEFIADYEIDYENNAIIWKGEKLVIENTRKDSTVTLQKLDFADSTAIPNCKFELRSLETDFVVEGVTDENGIYVFENIPYGRYTYTELEAPEEYIIDTEPHEITIDVEQVKIQVTNERMPEPPDTGDIAVVALAVLAVVCVAGIVFVVVRNKKNSSKK